MYTLGVIHPLIVLKITIGVALILRALQMLQPAIGLIPILIVKIWAIILAPLRSNLLLLHLFCCVLILGDAEIPCYLVEQVFKSLL